MANYYAQDTSGLLEQAAKLGAKRGEILASGLTGSVNAFQRASADAENLRRWNITNQRAEDALSRKLDQENIDSEVLKISMMPEATLRKKAGNQAAANINAATSKYEDKDGNILEGKEEAWDAALEDVTTVFGDGPITMAKLDQYRNDLIQDKIKESGVDMTSSGMLAMLNMQDKQKKLDTQAKKDLLTRSLSKDDSTAYNKGSYSDIKGQISVANRMAAAGYDTTDQDKAIKDSLKVVRETDRKALEAEIKKNKALYSVAKDSTKSLGSSNKYVNSTGKWGDSESEKALDTLDLGPFDNSKVKSLLKDEKYKDVPYSVKLDLVDRLKEKDSLLWIFDDNKVNVARLEGALDDWKGGKHKGSNKDMDAIKASYINSLQATNDPITRASLVAEMTKDNRSRKGVPVKSTKSTKYDAGMFDIGNIGNIVNDTSAANYTTMAGTLPHGHAKSNLFKSALSESNKSDSSMFGPTAKSADDKNIKHATSNKYLDGISLADVRESYDQIMTHPGSTLKDKLQAKENLEYKISTVKRTNNDRVHASGSVQDMLNQAADINYKQKVKETGQTNQELQKVLLNKRDSQALSNQGLPLPLFGVGVKNLGTSTRAIVNAKKANMAFNRSIAAANNAALQRSIEKVNDIKLAQRVKDAFNRVAKTKETAATNSEKVKILNQMKDSVRYRNWQNSQLDAVVPKVDDLISKVQNNKISELSKGEKIMYDEAVRQSKATGKTLYSVLLQLRASLRP